MTEERIVFEWISKHVMTIDGKNKSIWRHTNGGSKVLIEYKRKFFRFSDDFQWQTVKAKKVSWVSGNARWSNLPFSAVLWNSNNFSIIKVRDNLQQNCRRAVFNESHDKMTSWTDRLTMTRSKEDDCGVRCDDWNRAIKGCCSCWWNFVGIRDLMADLINLFDVTKHVQSFDIFQGFPVLVSAVRFLINGHVKHFQVTINRNFEHSTSDDGILWVTRQQVLCTFIQSLPTDALGERISHNVTRPRKIDRTMKLNVAKIFRRSIVWSKKEVKIRSSVQSLPCDRKQVAGLKFKQFSGITQRFGHLKKEKQNYQWQLEILWKAIENACWDFAENVDRDISPKISRCDL